MILSLAEPANKGSDASSPSGRSRVLAENLRSLPADALTVNERMLPHRPLAIDALRDRSRRRVLHQAKLRVAQRKAARETSFSLTDFPD